MVEYLFERSNLAQAFWSLVVGVVCFGLGVAWNSLQGPEKVVVTDRPQIDSMTIDVEGDDISSLSEEKLKSILRDEVSRLKSNSRGRESRGSRSSPGLPNDENLPEDVNDLQSPAFQMPDVVEGYSIERMSTIAQAECPDKKVERASIVRLDMILLGQVPLKNLTPIFLKINELRDDDNPLSVMREQYEIQEGLNTILFVSDFSRGTYELRYGFFRKKEVDRKYPGFYSKRCQFQIVSS